MALEKGINCGFVTSAPTADPLGLSATIRSYAYACKDIAPTGAVRVTEIGWWCDSASEDADFDVGIYSHDAVNNKPDALIGSALNNPKGTTSGWKVITGLDISIVEGTTYWLGVQADNTPSQTDTNYSSVISGEKTDYKSSQTSLPSPWGASSGSVARISAFYALVEGGGSVVWLAGTIAAAAALNAAPSVERKLSGAIAGAGGVSPASSVERKLTAAIAAAGGVSPASSVERKLTAAIAAAGGTAGTMSVIRSVLAAITAQGNLAGALSGNWTLTSMITAQGSLTGSLSGVGGGGSPAILRKRGNYGCGRGVAHNMRP